MSIHKMGTVQFLALASDKMRNVPTETALEVLAARFNNSLTYGDLNANDRDAFTRLANLTERALCVMRGQAAPFDIAHALNM